MEKIKFTEDYSVMSLATADMAKAITKELSEKIDKFGGCKVETTPNTISFKIALDPNSSMIAKNPIANLFKVEEKYTVTEEFKEVMKPYMNTSNIKLTVMALKQNKYGGKREIILMDLNPKLVIDEILEKEATDDFDYNIGGIIPAGHNSLIQIFKVRKDFIKNRNKNFNNKKYNKPYNKNNNNQYNNKQYNDKQYSKPYNNNNNQYNNNNKQYNDKRREY